jgi:hypothetical protein
MTEIFEKNLALFAKERPLEAMRIQMASDEEGAESRINLINRKMPWGMLYDEDPKKEAEKWFSELSLKGYKVLYIYGIGLGAYYVPLKKWLKESPEHHAVFIEDHLEAVCDFFRTDLATEFLTDHQATLCFIPDLEDPELVLDTLYWSFVLTPFIITGLKSYAEKKEEKYTRLAYQISYSATMKNALVEEYLRFGVAFFKNFYPNILKLHTSRSGNSLFGKFKGVPAVICGAGPSLDKQISLLGTIKDKALIFAGGSSLNALTAKNVFPHFGAGIDPNPTQLVRLKSSGAKGVPFFYRSRMMSEAFDSILGERLYIAGAGGYDVAEYYEKAFGLEEEFLDEGHNVVNFCTEVAFRLGCNPIIYVGMDLAFTGLKAYTSGIEENVDVSVEALTKSLDQEYRGVLRTDIYGKPIYTLWKWIGESDWLAEFAKTHPDCKLINSTEGGIGFPDIPNIPFQEAVKTYLKEVVSVQEKVNKAIDEAQIPHVTQEALFQLTKELKESLQKCICQLQILMAELELEKARPGSDGTLQSGRAALAESDLYEEPAFKYILDFFHQVFVRVQNKKIMGLRVNKNEEMDERELALGKITIQLEKLQFLKQVAEANILLIDVNLAKFGQ